MKQCTLCRKKKPIGEFNKNKVRKDGYSNVCKSCSHARFKRYYRENNAKHRAVIRTRNDRHIKSLQGFVFEYLLKHPCVDCGEKDPLVLEFDHRRDKDRAISRALRSGWSLKRLQAEIAKCQVRCANCHKRRTAKVQKHYKVKLLREHNRTTDR